MTPPRQEDRVIKRLLALAFRRPADLGGPGRRPERPWFPKNFNLARTASCTTLPPASRAGRSWSSPPAAQTAPLGIYVYDAPGGAACDDEPNVLGDERLVGWTPTDAGPYEIEIRNLGAAGNEVEAVFRGTGGGEK